jgi:hypothetical protein
MFRPITRRWGICIRSTQRYTVCGLTPRNAAASRTFRGFPFVRRPVRVSLFAPDGIDQIEHGCPGIANHRARSVQKLELRENTADAGDT